MDIDQIASHPGFLLFFRGKEWDEGLSPAEIEQVMGRFKAWSDGLCRSGKVRAGQALGRESRIISGQGGRNIADGPFAESKEVIGGYLLLHVDTFEEAVALAKTCPGLDFGGSIEIRPALEECPVFKRARERLGFAAELDPTPVVGRA